MYVFKGMNEYNCNTLSIDKKREKKIVQTESADNRK